MKLDDNARQAWVAFLTNAENLGHAERALAGDGIDEHVEACRQSALLTAQRIGQDLPGHEPRCILEVGASTGLNCFALQQLWPHARVIGIEPEVPAVRAAQAMAQMAQKGAPEFIVGYGESLPLPDGSVDLIVCHTVIEHVRDVDAVVAEMARVLSPHGALHLEAPNYAWPYEPHLGIWCLPLLGKPGVRLAAMLQGKKNQTGFLGHLQFVTSGRIEVAFRDNGLAWENRVRAKLERALDGDASQIKAYRRVSALLRLLASAGLSGLLVRFVMWSKLYPSVLYTVRKPRRG